MELHSLPLMDYLLDDMRTAVQKMDKEQPAKSDLGFQEPPPLGALNLQKVLESPFFFS